MFTILGGDGKEYGPVTAEQIRGWIAAGRANLDTKAKVAATDEWRRIGDIPEFTGENLPPPLTGASVGAVSPVVLTGGDAADRGLRLFAVVIDRLIGFVCALPGLVLLGREFIQMVLAVSRGQQPDFGNMDPSRVLIGISLLGFGILILAIVQIAMISTRGQSIGKRILGIRIIRYSTGANAGFVHGWLIRSFLVGLIGWIPWLGIIFGLTDICFIFREDNRCIHDLMADTRVVKV